MLKFFMTCDNSVITLNDNYYEIFIGRDFSQQYKKYIHMYLNIKITSKSSLLRNILYTFRMVLQNNTRFYGTRNNSTSVSALDDYTSNLVKEKSLKWQRVAKETNYIMDPLKAYVKEPLTFSKTDNLQSCIYIRTLPVGHIDTLLADVLGAQSLEDLKFMIEECILHDKMPSIHIFLEVVSFCSKRGLKDDVQKLQTFLQKVDPTQFKLNGNLNHFLAEILWVRGNTEEAMKTFMDSYVQYPQLKPDIRVMTKYMASELICKGSEAKLVMMTKFAKQFASDFNDYYLLRWIWELAFLSEWYSDQVWALDLLKEDPELLRLMKHKFVTLAIQCLYKHEVETVHRIMELLLAVKMRQQYITLLHVLFEYRYWRSDLRGCTEIMNVAITQGIPMRGSHQVKLVQLLLGNQQTKTPKPTKIAVPKYVLKF